MALAASLSAAAQQTPAPGASAAVGPTAALETQLLKTGLYLITGGGANSLVRFSAGGMILVDSKLAGGHRALKAQVRRIARISDLPIRVLVLTGHQPGQIGNAAEFVAGGVPVVVQAKGRRHLATLPGAGAKPGAPAIVFDDRYALRLGGVEAQILHFGNAQSDDDTVVFFPDLKVIAVGNLYTAQEPRLDPAASGSFSGWAAALEQVLKLDIELVVASAGPVLSKADLGDFKAKLPTQDAPATALAK